MSEEYDIAQICINGHVVNSSVTNEPDHSKKYCKKCGSETIINFPSCNAAIEGDCYTIIYDYDGPIKHKTESYILPYFCHNCGKAYPWTEKKIQTSQILIAESEDISPEEKAIMAKSIDDIIKDTPETIYSANRIKKILPKLGKEITKGFRDIFIDIASETAKRILFP